MRGKAKFILSLFSTIRITPAYAGKRRCRLRSKCRQQDHPRLCGEKREYFLGMKSEKGSPPPMRGKVPAAPSLPAAPGITPAYAGKSCTRFRSIVYTGDHPRLCGEKPAGVLPQYSLRGITPAYAGKSIHGKQNLPNNKDHPRLCGEKACMLACFTTDTGSPPPMRGKGPVRRKRCTGRQDHPRLCGEKWQ